jgi:hypothetical protein
MNLFSNIHERFARAAALALTALLCACGGGTQAPILGGLDVSATPVPPTVTAVVPLSLATAVALNSKVLTATFSKAMNPATLPAAVSLACPAGTVVSGTVNYNAATKTATLTLPTTPNLPANTDCTATITTTALDNTGLGLATNFSWSFRTSATPDTTAPTVLSTLNANGAVNVPVNTKVGATFSEAMNPGSLAGSNFVLKESVSGNPVAGALALSATTLLFTPTANLTPSTAYTATIKGTSGGASDVAGNVLAADYAWSWTTAATPSGDTVPPTVLGSNPLDAARGVCINKTINVTFSEAMDPLSVNNSSLTLAVTGGGSVAGLVGYDAITHIASFNPTGNLIGTPATAYTATIKSGAIGVKDLAGNAMVADQFVRFTTNASSCVSAPALGAIAPFGSFGGSATLTNDGLNTRITGDVGVNATSTTVTGLRDSGGNVYTVTPNNDGTVNGTIYTLTAPTGSVPGAAVIAAQADAVRAFNSISPASLAGGIDVSSLAQCPSCGGAGQGPGQLANRTLPPGVYLSTTGTFGIGTTAPTAGDLTLDAAGDTNAVWIFQTAAGTGTLTVGLTGPATPAVPIQVLLTNGALAKNVFWYVPAGATIGTGSSVAGTLLSNASITFSTTGGSPPTAVLTRLDGRAIAITAGVTMTNTLITVPAP